MEKLLDLISEKTAAAFTACGYEDANARVTISNRPDLCEFQCNAAMPLAKQHKKAPIREAIMGYIPA